MTEIVFPALRDLDWHHIVMRFDSRSGLVDGFDNDVYFTNKPPDPTSGHWIPDAARAFLKRKKD